MPRIAKNVKGSFNAAQELIQVTMISGYRSVVSKTELYNSYVQQEMAADPSLTESQAEKKVGNLIQPPGRVNTRQALRLI